MLTLARIARRLGSWIGEQRHSPNGHRNPERARLEFEADCCGDILLGSGVDFFSFPLRA
jgi:hypothetical protein